ncbi:MAG: EAL domain-containing protein [Chloroflexi bacterium]|nr:MAG: EAL domain-containing protein [Chloroflexota bacterium]
MDGYFKIVNPVWTRVLGYSTSELLAQPCIDFVHPDDRQATRAEAERLSNGLQSVHFRNRYRCKDGSYRWLAWTATPAMAEGLIYAGARDVTNAVRAEEVERQLARQQLSRIREAIRSDALTMVFQPIVSVPGGQVLGWEALARFAMPPNRAPDRWFEEASVVGLRQQLELRAVRDALAVARGLHNGHFVSVNASPETLLSPRFAALAREVGSGRLVVEVTEDALGDDNGQLRHAVDDLRSAGVRFAIDDAGAGFSRLRQIVQLMPEFLKLDVSLTRGIDSDPVKRSLASALVKFAGEIGAVLIAEGVETARELELLGELGVDEAQGFLLGKPVTLRT